MYWVSMSSQGLLDPLFVLGDTLLQLAPHNVILSLISGGALGSQSPVPAGATLSKFTTTTGKTEWGPGNLSVRATSGKVKVTAPQDMALVLTFQSLKRKTVVKRSNPFAGFDKDLGASDWGFVAVGAPETIIIGPEHQASIDKAVRKSGTVEEKGPFGVIVWKKTTMNYALDVALVGVLYKERVITSPSGETEEERRRRERRR